MRRFELARRAVMDLQEIWEYIAEEGFDLTARDVLFWPLRSYLIIYESASPLRIARVIHGKRDVRRLLKER